jgi:protein arginine kinase activator
MKCQICGMREATTHIKQNINGQISERHLCAHCAMEADAGLALPNVFQSLFGVFPGQVMPLQAIQERRLCPKCGLSFAEIAQAGKLGCADCYRTFYDQLEPTIQRIHGRVFHTDQKSPIQKTPAKETRGEKITKCKADLQEAIQSQNFERAAELRDEIRELEKGGEAQ